MYFRHYSLSSENINQLSSQQTITATVNFFSVNNRVTFLPYSKI